jgi:hypothetical protein
MITCPSTVEEATEASHVLRDPQFLRKAPNYGALLCRKLTSHGRIPSSKSLKASPHWQSLECVEGLLSSIGRGLSRTSPFDTLPAHKANRKLLSSKPCDSCPINLSSRRETSADRFTWSNIRHCHGRYRVSISDCQHSGHLATLDSHIYSCLRL